MKAKTVFFVASSAVVIGIAALASGGSEVTRDLVIRKICELEKTPEWDQMSYDDRTRAIVFAVYGRRFEDVSNQELDVVAAGMQGLANIRSVGGDVC